jgi:hypothetical protein
MNGIVVLVVSVVVSLISVWGGLTIARIYQRSYAVRRIAADEFYEIANQIIDHDDASCDDLDTISQMNSTINQAHTAMALGLVLYRSQKRGIKRGRAHREIPSPEVGELILLAYDRWFAAVTSRSPYFGAWARIMRSREELRPTVQAAANKVQHSKS